MRLRVGWLCLVALLGCRQKAPAHTVGLALDVGGRGDESFNDGALRGLEQMAAGLRFTARGYEKLPDADYPPELRARYPHLPIARPLVLSGKAQEDYEPNLQLLVDQGAELVVAVGFMMEPAVRAVSARNPGTRFLLVDSPLTDGNGKPTQSPNVRAIVFREHEGSFLAGIAASLVSKTGRIGFVGGMQLPLIRKFEVGYRAGARHANRGVDVLVAYTGSFDDEKKGIEVGQDFYSRRCDVVFQAAGLDGLGVIKAAQQARKLVIGVDSDQSHVAPGQVLTSMLKRVDVAVYLAVRDVVEGRFSGGNSALGLSEDAVGLAPLGPMVPAGQKEKVMAELGRARDEIVAGKLLVPATLDELSRFAAARK